MTDALHPYVDKLVPDCPECKTDERVILDSAGGKFVCRNCGLVCGDRLVTDESEWRTFSDEKGVADRNRVGGPDNPLLESNELSTALGTDSK